MSPPKIDRRAEPGREEPIVAWIVPDGRAVESVQGDVVVGGVAVTRHGGWLSLVTAETSVPIPLRRIAVRLSIRARERGANEIVIVRVRIADVEWRSVNSFLEATANSWAALLVDEAQRAIRDASDGKESSR